MPALKATPYNASVDRSLLKHAVFIKCFDDVNPDVTIDQFTNEDTERYLKSLIQNKDNIDDPTRLKEAMVELKFPANIRDPSARIKTYCADVFERLIAMSYEHFKTENPKHTLKILRGRIKQFALKNAMFEQIKIEPELEENVQLCITRLTED